jgi:predicted transcriptional regulator
MDKDLLRRLIEEGKSYGEIAKIVGKSKTTVSYWARKYNLKSKHTNIKNRQEKDCSLSRVCPMCKNTKLPKDYYKKRGKEGASTYCKECTNTQTTIRTKVFKRMAVEYKGGKCERCNYSKYIGALDFHHTNPEEKDFNIGKIRSKKLNKRVREELDKCELLCSNCHREVHEEMRLTTNNSQNSLIT